MATEGFAAIGINPVYLGSQIFSFVILLWVLKRFIYKPILKKLAERAEETKRSLEKAEEIAQSQEQFEEKQTKILEKSQIQAAELLSQAQKQAQKEKARIIDEAKNEAQSAAAAEYAKFEAKLKEQERKILQNTGKMVIKTSRKLLSQYLDKQSHHQILQKQLQKIKKVQLK